MCYVRTYELKRRRADGRLMPDDMTHEATCHKTITNHTKMKSSPLCALAISSAACCSAASAFVAPSSLPECSGGARCVVPPQQARQNAGVRPLFSAQVEAEEGTDWAVIRPEDDNEEWDLAKGGVLLAMDSAVKATGTVSGGSADAAKLLRYGKLTEASDADVDAALAASGSVVVCTGTGAELYKDPGLATVEEVTLGPMDAVAKALSSSPNVAALSGAKKVVINFLGGNGLMMDEILDAAGLLAQNMGDAAPSKMTFNSISHKDIADGAASVTVMAAGGGNADGALGEAVANGEAYFYQGKWYAVLDEDIIKD